MTVDLLEIAASIASTVGAASLVAIGAAAIKIARSVQRMELQIGTEQDQHTALGRLAKIEAWQDRAELRLAQLDRRRFQEPD